MIDPLCEKGEAMWFTVPAYERSKYRLRKVKLDALPWVRTLLYLAYTGDAKAIAARNKMFVRGDRHGFHPRGDITEAIARQATAPVLLETFTGENGRRFG